MEAGNTYSNEPDQPTQTEPGQTPPQTDQPQPGPGTAVAETVEALRSDTPDQPADTNALLHQLIEEQKAQRAEIGQLRAEASRTQAAAVPQSQVTVLSDEEKLAARQDEIANASHYCPACGRLYQYPRECTGTDAAPHPALDVVSTDELSSDDTSGHTPAPASE